uniref:HECT-type E3 ubiquitin transferase n=1 Tax=Ficedula albicollis TaxID=59894 RepID=A0A803VDP3_FICAL
GYQKLDRTIRNFWTVFHKLPEEKKKMFLENPDELSPYVSTCQHILFLPRYSSKKILKKNLLYAIEHNEGFGRA